MSDKRAFLSLDYESVTVAPTPDGLNNSVTRSTFKYKLRSVQEWIDRSCEDMETLFRRIQTNPEIAQTAVNSFRSALKSSFPPETYSLDLPPRELSKRNRKMEASEDESDHEEKELDQDTSDEDDLVTELLEKEETSNNREKEESPKQARKRKSRED